MRQIPRQRGPIRADRDALLTGECEAGLAPAGTVDARTRGWPVTPAGRAAQKNLVRRWALLCRADSLLAVLDEMRSIEIGKDGVVMRFDNSAGRNSGDGRGRRHPNSGTHAPLATSESNVF